MSEIVQVLQARKTSGRVCLLIAAVYDACVDALAEREHVHAYTALHGFLVPERTFPGALVLGDLFTSFAITTLSPLCKSPARYEELTSASTKSAMGMFGNKKPSGQQDAEDTSMTAEEVVSSFPVEVDTSKVEEINWSGSGGELLEPLPTPTLDTIDGPGAADAHPAVPRFKHLGLSLAIIRGRRTAQSLQTVSIHCTTHHDRPLPRLSGLGFSIANRLQCQGQNRRQLLRCRSTDGDKASLAETLSACN